MSAIINNVSNQESDTRYAAIKKPDLTIVNIANTFIKKYKTMLAILEEFNNFAYIKSIFGSERPWSVIFI